MKLGKASSFGLLMVPLALATSSCVEQEKEQTKPNIIFILADDLGYAELGAYGQQKIKTPHIDQLASQGIRFTDFYCGSPVCAPSRGVLLTGRHSGHAYVRNNDEMGATKKNWDFREVIKDPGLEGQRPILNTIVTVGELMQQAGYRTACVGKWGLGGPLTEGHPNKQGFDLFYGDMCQRQGHNYYNLHLWKNDQQVLLDNEYTPVWTSLDKGSDPLDPASYKKYTSKEYAPDLMLDESLRFIEQNKANPFFLYFAPILPHAPLQVPADSEFLSYYQEQFGDEEPYLGQRGYFPNRTPHATYAAMVSYLDMQVGKLIDKLKKEGLYENTVIMFTSDNGPTFNGGTDSPFFDSAKPFKSEWGWGKGFLREGGIRVPLIVSWPGVVAPGSETNSPFAFWDVMPTLNEIAGLQTETETDGTSFLPTLKGETQAEKEFLYWEFPMKAYGGQQAVRMGDWKGYRSQMNDGNLTTQLFNLKTDPQEQQDLASEHPEIVAQIEKIMKQEHERSEVHPFPAID